MSERTALLEVGRIVKPHGLRGAVVVSLVTNRAERVAPGSVLVGIGDDGVHQRLEIERSSPHQGRHLVAFAGVATIEAAEDLRGVVLFAEPLGPEDDAYFVHELIGAEVVDQHGIARGRVTAVEANPASDLLVVEDRYYVPLRFVVSRSPGRLQLEVPEGLFE